MASDEWRVTRKLIIAIDGPVGSGKSTVARRVAELLGYAHLDSGAMYRALALAAMRRGISLDDAAELERLAREVRIELAPAEAGPSGAEAPQKVAKSSKSIVGAEAPTPYEENGELKLAPTQGAAGTRVMLEGEDVTAEIRTPEMSQAASQVAVHEGVRKPLVAAQQRMGAAGGVVMEGRDIGTVVFPQAELKIYLDASVEERARRRLHEHTRRGEEFTLEEMIDEVHVRDRRDKEREVSPLVLADDAVYVDCTAMDAEETARLIAMLAREREKGIGNRE